MLDDRAPSAALLLAGLGEAVMAHDRDGRLVYANPAAAALDERPSLAALVEARDPEALWRVRLRATGEIRFCRARWRVVLDGDRALTVTTLHDLTDRKEQAEGAELVAEAGRVLASSLDYQVTLNRVARLGIPLLADWCTVHLLGPDGRLELIALAHGHGEAEALMWERGRRYPPRPGDPAGPAVVARTGRTESWADVSDETLAALAHDAEHLELLRESGIRSGVSVPLEARGRTIGVLTLAYAESGRRSTPARQAVAEALAQRAALAIDNARLYEEAQGAVLARRDLMAIVSHDLKNPLSAILVSANALGELLRPGAAATPETLERARHRADLILRAAHRMSHLVGALLDSASIEAGRLSIDRKPQPLAPVVADACEAMETLVRQKGLSLETRIGPCPRPVMCDRERVVQVLSNLIANAIQFTTAGRITVEAEAIGDEARLAVGDTGAGIAEDGRAHLFERYWRGERTGRPGTGLGLYIAKGIVDAHGGRIWVESAVGRGSTFYFTLPLSR